MALGFDALERALARVSEAVAREQFAPLAESLLWLVMINDAFWQKDTKRYRRIREDDPDGKAFEGLRYARHRLVHDIRVYGMHGVIDHVGGFSRGFGVGFDVAKTEWRWRGIDTLAKTTKRMGEDVYRKRLQGWEVEPSLRAAASFLGEYRKGWSPNEEE